VSKPEARIGRVVVHTGRRDPVSGQRLAAKLPAALERTLRDAGSADARTLRALVERAVREAAR
jgi:hypothetical protein